MLGEGLISYEAKVHFRCYSLRAGDSHSQQGDSGVTGYFTSAADQSVLNAAETMKWERSVADPKPAACLVKSSSVSPQDVCINKHNKHTPRPMTTHTPIFKYPSSDD